MGLLMEFKDKTTPPNRAEAIDYELVDYYISTTMSGDCRRREQNKGDTPRYRSMTELHWVGKHYLLLRMGPEVGNERNAVLVNREGLLLRRGNRDDNPMIELALSSIHPVHRNSGFKTILLHNSSGGGGLKDYRNRRWSKNLRNEFINYARLKDASFEEEEQELIDDYERKAAASEKNARFVENNLDPTIIHNAIEGSFPHGHRFDGRIFAGSRYSRSSIRFNTKSDKTVNVSIDNTNLRPDEFEVLVRALGEIRAMRQEREIQEDR